MGLTAEMWAGSMLMDTREYGKSRAALGVSDPSGKQRSDVFSLPVTG